MTWQWGRKSGQYGEWRVPAAHSCIFSLKSSFLQYHFCVNHNSFSFSISCSGALLCLSPSVELPSLNSMSACSITLREKRGGPLQGTVQMERTSLSFVYPVKSAGSAWRGLTVSLGLLHRNHSFFYPVFPILVLLGMHW